jgi:hypothetical protein
MVREDRRRRAYHSEELSSVADVREVLDEEAHVLVQLSSLSNMSRKALRLSLSLSLSLSLYLSPSG